MVAVRAPIPDAEDPRVACRAGKIPNTSAANSDVALVNTKTGMTSPTSAAQQWPVIEFLELFRKRLGGLLRP